MLRTISIKVLDEENLSMNARYVNDEDCFHFSSKFLMKSLLD